MQKLFKRVGCFFVLLIWLGLLLLPVGMFRLAREGELSIRNTRIFLLQDNEGEGVGFVSTTPARNESTCTRTRARYILWEGAADATHNCLCADGIERQPRGRSCVLP